MVKLFNELQGRLGITSKKLLEYLAKGTFDYNIVLLDDASEVCEDTVNALDLIIKLRGKPSELAAFIPDLRAYKIMFKSESYDTSIVPAFFSNTSCPFNLVNWEHILGKHSTRYFDFEESHMGDSGKIHMFDDTIQQEDIANFIDKVLQQLISEGEDLGSWVEGRKFVNVGAYQFAIGVAQRGNNRVIGQFYSKSGPTVLKFKPNILELIKILI